LRVAQQLPIAIPSVRGMGRNYSPGIPFCGDAIYRRRRQWSRTATTKDKKMGQLQEMMVEQLRDAFSAEKQAIQGMKRALRKISLPELKEGTQAHIEQSEEQRTRVTGAALLVVANGEE
jgi:hypothetical protein